MTAQDPKDRFDPEAWRLVASSPNWVAMPILQQGSGVFYEGIREFDALTSSARRLALAPDFAGNALIDRVLQAWLEEVDDQDDENEGPTEEAEIEAALARLRELVEGHAEPDEAVGFLRYLRALSGEVAQASREGLFGTGPQVDEQEQRWLETVDRVLGLPSESRSGS